MRINKILKSTAVVAASAATAVTAAQLIRYAVQPIVQSLPKPEKNPDVAQGGDDSRKFLNVYYYYMGKPTLGDDVIDEKYLYEAMKRMCAFVAHRFDCSDFRMQLIFRIYKDCYDKLSSEMIELIETTCLNFKYFMDEPGQDSMCYWSENHQVLFAVSEYLSGQEWKNRVFTNSGMTGEQHMAKAKNRLENWMKQRFEFGFSEYLSNVYILEDLAPMSNFIEYCEDEVLKNKMKMIMDLLWFDIAIHTCNNRFVAASSRMYGNNKSANYWGNSVLPCMNAVWGKQNFELAKQDKSYSKDELDLLETSLNKPISHMSANFIAVLEKGVYKVPEAIVNVALSKKPQVSKMSSGLSTEDMVEHDLIGQEPHQIMAQFGAETFTQPEVVNNTVKYITNNNIVGNSFISYFKYLDVSLVRPWFLKGFTKSLNLMTHGISLGRGNIYSYKTRHYSMTTLVNNDADLCGTQDHIWTANIAENLTLYTTHPSRDDGNFTSSPGYFIGNGRKPMSMQDENVNITIYKIPKVLRPAEFKKADITHAYMPKCFYDEFEHDGDIIFARRDKVFVALLSNGEMKFRDFNEDTFKAIYKETEFYGEEEKYMIKGEFDLVRQGGEYHCYVTELSSSDEESFDEFKSRISKNKIIFAADGVTYETRGKLLKSNYRGQVSKNLSEVDLNYLRYDNDYCTCPRSSEVIEIKNEDKIVKLNFNDNIREITE